MQAIKEKWNDMSAMRKAKAEAKEEEKSQKELAKAKVEVAHEVRMAREAEAAMDLHVNKAAEKVAEHDPHHDPNAAAAGYPTDGAYGSESMDSTASIAGSGHATSRSGGPPTSNLP